MIVRNLLAGVGLLGVVMAGAIAVSANWDTGPEAPPRLVVSYSGLDLRSAEGQRLLDERIRRAARQICDRHESFGASQSRLVQRCFDNALASARPQVDLAVARANDPEQGALPERASILSDLDAQPSGIRKSIRSALARAFNTGITANWYSWSARGLVFAGPRSGSGVGSCRFMTVTSRSHGAQDLLTRGWVCLSSYGLLEAPADGR